MTQVTPIEGRKPEPYAEPVAPEALVVGDVYFALTYDDEMVLPLLEPLVFAGKNLEKDDVDDYYFQDVWSYRQGARYKNLAGVEATFHHGDAIKHMFQYEKALDRLLECSLRRKAKGLL